MQEEALFLDISFSFIHCICCEYRLVSVCRRMCFVAQLNINTLYQEVNEWNGKEKRELSV